MLKQGAVLALSIAVLAAMSTEASSSAIASAKAFPRPAGTVTAGPHPPARA